MWVIYQLTHGLLLMMASGVLKEDKVQIISFFLEVFGEPAKFKQGN